MIYLENTTLSQKVYIPRQAIQTATTREVDYVTSGDVQNMIDANLSGYSTTEQVEGLISAATSGMATEQWVQDQGYLTEHQSLSAYSTTEEMNTAIDAAVGAESARSESTYAKPSDIPDVSEFVTSGQVKNQVEEYHYVNSGDVKSQIEDYNYATEQWVEDKHYLTEHQSLSAYTKTEDFATINGSGITNGGNLIIQGGGEEYTAGENINIDDNNVISVTGITIPDVSNFVTSADVKSQVEEYNYVNSGEVKTQIEGYHYTTSGEVETQINDKHFITSGDANTQINSAIAAETARTEETYAKPADIPDVSDFVTSGQVKTQIEEYGYATTGQVNDAIANETARTEDIYAKISELEAVSGATNTALYGKQDTLVSGTNIKTINNQSILGSGNIEIQGGGGTYTAGDNINIDANNVISVTGITVPDVSDFVTSADVKTQIDSTVSAYTKTTDFATINGSGITNGGNLVIQGGGGGNANIIEITKAEYSALTSYTEDALYVISDADTINMDNYATSADVATKADKANVTANGSANKFPYWNSQGIITGQSTSNVYQTNINKNGDVWLNVWGPNAGNFNIGYLPQTAGSSGQILQSSGSGAPSWSQYSFEYLTQEQYDALSTKSSTTIYFIID